MTMNFGYCTLEFLGWFSNLDNLLKSYTIISVAGGMKYHMGVHWCELILER